MTLTANWATTSSSPGRVRCGRSPIYILLSRFIRDESGTTSVEYAVIGMLISVAIIVAAAKLGGVLDDTFVALGAKIPGRGG
jgi:pilus assembly protein Flp/PilA